MQQVDGKVRKLALGKKTTEKQAVLNITSAKEIARNLEEFHTHAFDGPNARA